MPSAAGVVTREFISRAISKSGGPLAIGMTALDAYTYHKDKKADLVESVAYAGLMYIGWSAFAPVMWAWTLKDVAAALGAGVARTAYSKKTPLGYREGIGRGFMDNAAKATMRQRAVQALQESRMRGNMILGREASRISRGYFELY